VLGEELDSAKNLKPEGDSTIISYQHKETSGADISYLQIRHNYQNAAKALKVKILVGHARYIAMQIDKKGARIYVGIELFNEGHNIVLTTLEQKLMEQEITANDMWMGAGKAGGGIGSGCLPVR
jgi:hypothetical protein